MSTTPSPDPDEGTLTLVAMPAADGDDPDEREELADYLTQLDHALGLVAAYARFEPELVLWCCRRAGELALRCVHLHFGALPIDKPNPTFRELKSHGIPETKLSEVLGMANVHALDILQNQGNLGVHARLGGRSESESAVKTAVPAVEQVVRALFTDRALGPHQCTDSIRRHLKHIGRGGHEQRPDLHRIEALEQQLKSVAESAQTDIQHWKGQAAELAGHIEVLTAQSDPTPQTDLEGLLTTTRTALKAAEADAVRARAQALQWRETLDQKELLVELCAVPMPTRCVGCAESLTPAPSRWWRSKMASTTALQRRALAAGAALWW